MNRIKYRKQEHGFTIIELMIATTVFSVVLLICSFAMLQIGRTYYKGITMARTQTTARSIIDEISQSIQFSGGTVYPTVVPTTNNACIGRVFYERTAANGLNKYTLGSDCTNSVSLPPSPPLPVNMLGNNMRLGKFEVKNVAGAPSLWSVTIRVVYGDNDVLSNPTDLATTGCKDSGAGGQFCAISELSTIVQKKL